MIPNGNVASNSHQTLLPSMKILSGKTKKAPEEMVSENKNWLIYFHYTRREFGICKLLIKEELAKTSGMNEYANYIQGIILRHEGKIQESLDYFQKCHLLNPKSADNIKQVARSLSLLGRQKLSLDALQEAKLVSQVPDWSVYHNLGLCYYNLNDLRKSKEYLSQAMQLGRQECSFTALAEIHIKENDVQSAIEVYSAALKVSPDSVDLATSLGLLYMKTGDNQKAFEQFGSALAHHPDCPKALLATGLMMQKHREYDVALSKYKTASVRIPESPSLWNNIGMCFFGKQKLVAAITCLKRANCLAPLEWKILYNLGLVHISSQQYASAFHFLSSALNLQPKSGSLFLPLAITLGHLNDVKNAGILFGQTAKQSPEDPLVLLNHALFLYKQNEISRAVDEYKKFQEVAQRVTLDNGVLRVASTLRQLLNVNPSQADEQGNGKKSKKRQKSSLDTGERCDEGTAPETKQKHPADVR